MKSGYNFTARTNQKQKKAKLSGAESLLYRDFSPSVTASPCHLPRQREENKVFQQKKLSP